MAPSEERIADDSGEGPVHPATDERPARWHLRPWILRAGRLLRVARSDLGIDGKVGDALFGSRRVPLHADHTIWPARKGFSGRGVLFRRQSAIRSDHYLSFEGRDSIQKAKAKR